MKKLFARLMVLVVLLNAGSGAFSITTVHADDTPTDLTQKIIDRTGTVLGGFFKETNDGKKTRGFLFLGYAGVAMDVINMFLPSDPDPVMEKLKGMDNKLDSMSSQINNQGADLFEHQDKATYAAALTNLNGDVDQLTDARQNDLNKIVNVAQIVAAGDKDKIAKYMPSIDSGMQRIYEADNQTVYLNAFRKFAKDISGQGAIFGQDDICTIYDNWMHTTVDWNSQSFDGRAAFYDATANTLNYTYGVLTMAINYDLELKQIKADVDNEQLAIWDKLEGSDRDAINGKYRDLANEAYGFEQDVKTDKELLSTGDKATVNNSIAKGREEAQKKIDAAKGRLDAEKTEFNGGKIRSYRLQNRTVRRAVQVVYGPRFAASISNYNMEGWENFKNYTADQQNTVDNRLGKDEILALKDAAERRGMNLFQELNAASFQGKTEDGGKANIDNSNYAIWAGEAHMDKKSYSWFTTGHQEVYVKVISNANKTAIEDRQVVAYEIKAGSGKTSSQLYEHNPYVLAWG
ncbi:MAG: hypothetical protein LBT80_04075 [Lactobacillaceae bacterium]|nr:hypothetical protein [Lactobacillaceae bacterium]